MIGIFLVEAGTGEVKHPHNTIKQIRKVRILLQIRMCIITQPGKAGIDD